MRFHPLLPELIDLQRREGYLRPEALEALAQRLDIPLNRLYGVASFYRAFRFVPCGKHQIKVCIGAACYVKGGAELFDAFGKYLGLKDGSDTTDDGLFTLSKVACLGCCMLAVAVQIDRHIYGHVTADAIPSILRDFLQTADAEDASNEATGTGAGRAEIRVCRCSSCRAAGSGRIFDALVRERDDADLPYDVKEVGCHGMSYRAPLVTIAVGDAVYHYDRVHDYEVKAILANHFTPARFGKRLSWSGRLAFDTFYSRKTCSCAEKASATANEPDRTRMVTLDSGIVDPESLDDYRAHGGFAAFEQARNMTPDAIVELLKQSKLRGRGGGGFLTAQKWRLALDAPGERKIVVCNADEGDPGAFMDRMLMESYPCRVLEGIMIAALTIRADYAVIYIRDEYTQAVGVLRRVIEKMKAAGLFEPLGPDFDVILFRGAGAFVCGEETALLESIEGRRGVPRARPPFPVTNGLFGLPTLMNNVETFACVPVILADGGARFNSCGTRESHGTKAFALAGKVRRGGLVEVPIGISIRDIVDKYGGGAEEGHEIKAVMIGGPSGGCIHRRRFDLAVDYKTLQQNGAMMGSGGLIVLDERDCMVDLSLYYLRFLRDESCGKCTMCREGVPRLCDLVERLTTHGEKSPDLLDRIGQLALAIQRGSLCALGRTAPNMVLSALHEFRGEFEAHMRNECPAGKCVELTRFEIDERCIGCTKCAQVCAADAIECVPLNRARIVFDKCVKCGVCRNVCPAHAIHNVHTPCPDEEQAPFPSYRPATVEGGNIEIDGALFPFEPGRTMLGYAEKYGWYLPTLCYLRGVNEKAHCMVCAVWDATVGRFVPGCEQLLQRGHVYETKGERVREFRRTAISLMLDRHDFRCGQCAAKSECRLLELVKEYKAKKETTRAPFDFDDGIKRADHIVYDANKCILCQRCIGASQGRLTVCGRAERTFVTPGGASWNTISEILAKTLCDVCPTGALMTNHERAES